MQNIDGGCNKLHQWHDVHLMIIIDDAEINTVVLLILYYTLHVSQKDHITDNLMIYNFAHSEIVQLTNLFFLTYFFFFVEVSIPYNW